MNDKNKINIFSPHLLSPFSAQSRSVTTTEAVPQGLELERALSEGKNATSFLYNHLG